MVLKAASIISSPEKANTAFISPDIDRITQATTAVAVKTVITSSQGQPNNSRNAALSVTLNMATGKNGMKGIGGIGGRGLGGRRGNAGTSSKRTFIPSMNSVSNRPGVSSRSLQLDLDTLESNGSECSNGAYTYENEDGIASKETNTRRNFLSKLAAACLTTSSSVGIATSAIAATERTEDISSDVNPTSFLFKRGGNGYEYSFLPPPGFASSNKPLKTHLDEMIFALEGIRGYQYGITVDPVRINSLKEFGTPDQVATRVVNAESNRDGITNVQLVGTPTEDPSSGIYAIDYISDGKRGTKHFVTRISVNNGYLYVLTAQVKQADFNQYEKEILETVQTFQVF